jgi:hypothetical protein
VKVTGIEVQVLTDSVNLRGVLIAKRMSWAARPQATRIEDEAYPLLGIFCIHMTIIRGHQLAFVGEPFHRRHQASCAATDHYFGRNIRTDAELVHGSFEGLNCYHLNIRQSLCLARGGENHASEESGSNTNY